MPLYGFKCTKCGLEFEDIKPSEMKYIKHPECGGKAVRLPSVTKAYSISGNNSASTKPNRARATKSKRN